MKTNIKNHKHTWIVASIAILLAIATVIFLPMDKEYSVIFFGIALGHILMLLIALFTGWIIIPQRIIAKIWKKKATIGYDFGWSPKWLYSFAFASIIVLFLAVFVYFTMDSSAIIRLLIYSLLFAFSINLFLGFVVLSNSKRKTTLTLPMVTLLPDGKGSVLDAGCGAGRTTIALAKGIHGATITALDRFDADYIDGGGVDLLRKNLSIAEIDHRVFIEKGDITETKFSNNTFDAIISSYMFDHLGPNKKKALAESYRVLKPGGRFLLIIAIRSYSTFAIGSLLCLLFPSRNKWKLWIEEAGFKMISDGKLNEGAYFCFEKK